MKIKNIFVCFLMIAGSGIIAPGCSKQVSTPSSSTGTFMFHLHTNLDSLELEAYNETVTLHNGRKISVKLAQLYISDIELIRLDGSVYPVTGAIVLKQFEYEPYVVGQVPAGNYKSVRFRVGLDTTDNMKTPSGVSDSLFNHSEMWFGSTPQPDGYIFVNFQGTIDTSAQANGMVSQMQPFSYKIGNEANFMEVSLPEKDFSILPGQETYVHLIINYMELFKGIDLQNPQDLTLDDATGNAGTLGKTLAKNIPSMFQYED